jgi:hypothetical protein
MEVLLQKAFSYPDFIAAARTKAKLVDFLGWLETSCYEIVTWSWT